MSAPLSERLEALIALRLDAPLHASADTEAEWLREAAELARRVEGAPVCDVEECRYEFAPEEFDTRGSIHCDARLAGKRVALVEVE